MPSTIWVRPFSVPPAWMASTICWSSAVFTSSMNCSGLRFCGSNSAVAMDRSFLEFLAGCFYPLLVQLDPEPRRLRQRHEPVRVDRGVLREHRVARLRDPARRIVWDLAPVTVRYGPHHLPVDP